MEERQPFGRIEVRDDGYLWVVDFEEQSKTEGQQQQQPQQPLLLHSTSVLLHQLQEKWHDDTTNNCPNETTLEQNDKQDEQDAEIMPSGDNHQDENNCDENESENENASNESEEEEKQDDDDDGDDSTVGSLKDEVSKEDREAELLRYQQLKRETNLGDRIAIALTHIRLFKHETQKKKNGKGRKERSNARESKVKALEHQRERLLQQKKQQEELQNGDIGEARQEDQCDDDHNIFESVPKKSNEELQDDDDGASVSSAIQPLENPYVRMVRTLNSVRALVPIIRPVLFHQDRTNKDILMGRKKLKLPQKRKTQIWIICNHVFDYVNITMFRSLQLQFHEVVATFLPYELATDIYNGFLLDDFWCQKWLTYVWVPPQPNYSINIDSPVSILKRYQDAMKDRAEGGTVEEFCRSLDERFFADKRSKGEAHKQTSDRKKYQQAVNHVHNRISHVLARDFPGARLSVYGSCLSNLSLKGSDVDLSLSLPQAERIKKSFENGYWSPSRYEKEMAKLVREVWRKLMYRKSEFTDMVPVTRARVPVVKGSYLNAKNPYTVDGSLHFDICFLNDIAVANSSLLREYSMMNESIRQLMITVKQWAKEKSVCSAQDNTLSSYAWLNMVVFYLQCIRYVPNLQCPKLMEQLNNQRNPEQYWHNVNNLDTFYLSMNQAMQVWKRPEHFDTNPVSVTALIYGFFNFYAISFKGSVSMISIKRGREHVFPKTVFRKCSPFFCIEDPFETFDSHCPHDLGIPVNEVQTWRIFQLIQDTEEHLRNKLIGFNDDSDNEMSSTTLWSTKEQLERTVTKKAGADDHQGNAKKKNRRERNRGQKLQQQQERPGKEGMGGNANKVPQKIPKQVDQTKSVRNGKKGEPIKQRPNVKNGQKNKQQRNREGTGYRHDSFHKRGKVASVNDEAQKDDKTHLPKTGQKAGNDMKSTKGHGQDQDLKKTAESKHPKDSRETADTKDEGANRGEGQEVSKTGQNIKAPNGYQKKNKRRGEKKNKPVE